MLDSLNSVTSFHLKFNLFLKNKHHDYFWSSNTTKQLFEKMNVKKHVDSIFLVSGYVSRRAAPIKLKKHSRRFICINHGNPGMYRGKGNHRIKMLCNRGDAKIGVNLIQKCSFAGGLFRYRGWGGNLPWGSVENTPFGKNSTVTSERADWQTYHHSVYDRTSQ